MKADGAMRDALSIFDQVASSTNGNITYQSTVDILNVLDSEFYFRLVDYFREGNAKDSLLILNEIIGKGFDPQYFVNGLASHIRDLMVASDPRTIPLLETSEKLAEKYKTQSASLTPDWYYRALQILNECDINYKTSGNKRLLVEIALLKLSRLSGVPFESPAAKTPQERPDTANKVTEAKETVSKQNVLLQPSSPIRKEQTRTPINPSRQSSSMPKSFRISDIKDDLSKKSGEKGSRKKEFTDDDLSAAWTGYINDHPEQRILTSAMRSSLPQKTKDGEYEVKVSHPAQLQAFEMSMKELMDYLHDKLENDGVIVRVSVAEENGRKEMLSPKEFLKNALQENEELAKFLKAIDAELE